MAESIEERIQVIGKQLLTLARAEEDKLAKQHRWENALLDWCMANTELKTRAFRFIDVFPQLRSPRSVLRHIREYFPQSEQRIPAAIRAGLALTGPSILTQGAVNHLTRTMFTKIATLFVAAADENEAMGVFSDLDQQGYRCSFDLLGEGTMSERDADEYFRRYQGLIHELGKLGLGFGKQNISVKLSALDPCFDPIDAHGTSHRVRGRLRRLIELGQQQQVFIHIDMEEYAVRNMTVRILRDLLEEGEFKQGVHIGVVLQAYLVDAERCFESVLKWARDLPQRLTIRLVRGAYWDQEVMHAQQHHWPVPVFQKKHETDAMFERLAERILDERSHLRLALATHNIRSIAHTIAHAEQQNIAQDDLEFQVLYGMGAPLMGALRQLGQPPRVYMPIGEPISGMAYLVRRLLENVSQQSFVRRGIHEDENAEQLLAAPAVVAARPDPTQPDPAEAASGKQYSACPLLQFFESGNRTRFAEALTHVASDLGMELPVVIDGQSRQKKQRLRTVCPHDGGTTIVDASLADEVDVDHALTAAERSFPGWAATPVGQRAELLRRAAQWMQQKRHELAALTVHEVGKPWREADADVVEAIDFLNYYAFAAERLQIESLTEPLLDEINVLRPTGRGVCAVIAPWNFPIAILTGMSAAALVSGNPVIIKPAEQSMLCARRVFEAYREAGFPGGVIHFLPGKGEQVGRALVEDPRVAIIAFTGSKAVGLEIAASANRSVPAQKRLKQTIVEMGGKNAAIVDETADLDQTIPAVLQSAFGYAGQKCSALSRLIVVESIYDLFIQRLIQAASSFPVGDPRHPQNKCGPVIDQDSVERIQSAISEGERSGRKLFQSDISHLSKGNFVAPTIISDLPADSRLLREEIFGPVLAVVRARTFDDALAIANNTDFALTGGLFSRTPSYIARAKREFAVGNLYINRPITGAIVGRQPFGGYKLSGSGTKAGSMDYLREFYFERTISENVARQGFAPQDA